MPLQPCLQWPFGQNLEILCLISLHQGKYSCLPLATAFLQAMYYCYVDCSLFTWGLHFMIYFTHTRIEIMLGHYPILLATTCHSTTWLCLYSSVNTLWHNSQHFAPYCFPWPLYCIIRIFGNCYYIISLQLAIPW